MYAVYGLTDSSVLRALVRKTRGPGFDPQLRCLNFFPVLRPRVSPFFLRLLRLNGITDYLGLSKLSKHKNSSFNSKRSFEINPIQARLFSAPVAWGRHNVPPVLETMFLL